MGLFDKIVDAVKGGAREMVVERPEGNTDMIWKHPDATLPLHAQAVVRPDEWMVFARLGSPVGTLDSGRLSLSPANVPFLTDLASPASPDRFEVEVYFVRRSGIEVRLDRDFGLMRDPVLGTSVPCRASGVAHVAVENPERLVYQRFGVTHSAAEELHAWLADAICTDLREVFQSLAVDTSRSLRDAARDPEALKSIKGPMCVEMGIGATLQGVEITARDEIARANFEADRAAMKPAEEELKREEQRLAALFQQTQDDLKLGQARVAALMAQSSQSPAPTASPASTDVQCGACGARVRSGKFCSECGVAL